MDTEKITRARILRAQIETMAQSLDDETAETVPELFPEWNPDSCSYVTGDRVKRNGLLYKVLQPHTSQAGWPPEDAPSLFARILPGQGGTAIGVWVKPDSTNPYMAGDRTHYPTMADPIYESLIDNNVWSPEEYPQGWKLVE